MRRRYLLAAPCAVAWALAVACLPAYEFGGASPPDVGPEAATGDGATDGTDGSTDGGGPDAPHEAGPTPAAMVRLDPPPKGGSFTFRLDTDGGGPVDVSGELTYSFAIDAYEVTVERFLAWMNAGHPAPCSAGPCSLDQGGPHAAAMSWDPSWNQHLAASVVNCTQGPATYGTPTTYGRDAGVLPMTCATWYDAVAFCAWDNKRLPTELEWQFAATSRGATLIYPWDTASAPAEPASCNLAIFDLDGGGMAGGACGFPRAVGSAPGGKSLDGVYDLTGSVFEWVWDFGQPFPGTPGVNYVASTADAGRDVRRVRRGGAFNTGPGADALLNTARDPNFGAYENFDDLGFRCVKSL